MKKLLALLLVFAMCFGILAACGQNNTEGTEPPATTTAPPAPAEDPDLASAVAYVKNIYKTVSEKTPQDFVRVGNVPMGEKSYEVVWSVDVAEDLIKIVKNEDGSVTIDVNEDADKDTPYVLTATLTGTDGRTETLSWNHLLPASLGGNMSAIVDAGYALADGEKLDGVYTLTGKIINVDTPWNNEYKNITVTIAVEGKEDKPIMCYRLTGDDLDAVKKLAYGDTITVSGTLKNYKGTIEFDAGCKLLEVVKGDGKGPEAPETYEEIVAEAYELAEGKSLPYTATLTGKVIRIDYGYSEQYGDISLTFECRGKQFYCYRMTGPEEWLKQVGKGDWITVKGKIKNYYGTVEFDAGCKMIAYTDWVKAEDVGEANQVSEIAIGDVIVMANGSTFMGKNANGSRLAGVEAEIVDNTVVVNDDMLQLTVSYNGTYYVFTNPSGKYLTTGSTGGSLTLEKELSNYAKWKVESAGDGVFYITSAFAKYAGKLQQMEYYSGFTTFSPGTSDIYKIAFYKIGEGEAVEIPAEPETPETPEEPAEPTTLTIPEAIALGNTFEKNKYSDELYRVTGVIESISNTTYGNMYIQDAEGNKLLIYGLYNEAGDRFDAMDPQPAVGDTITVEGVIGKYNEPQMKNACLVEETDKIKTLTITEAVELGNTFEKNKYSDELYRVTGAIESISNTTYGNMYIQDAEGNKLLIYGLYSADGSVRFDAMDPQPAVGDTITVVGVIGKYNEPQMKNGWMTKLVPGTPETPTGTSATLMTAEPENGDVIAIGFGETILTDRANGKKLTGAAATIAEGVATLTDEMAQLTVTKDGDYYIFSKDGKYLSTGLTGGNLTFASELTNCARWTLKAVDGGWYITNARAYNNQAMEYYSGFTTYGLNTDKTVEQNAAYVLQLYYVKDGTPVTIPAFAKPETAEDIVAAAYDLLAGTTLAEGPYTLTGEVAEIVGGNNVSITVEGKHIVCRALADGAAAVADVEVGDTVTVKGQLKNDAGTIVFDEGCTLEKVEKFVMDELPSKLTYNFSAVAQNSSTLSNDAALAAFLAAEANNNLMSVTVSTVYPGNGSGGAFANQGGFLKTGTGSKPGQLVLTFTDTAKVTKVEIKCHDWYTKSESHPTNSNTVAVNGSAAVLAPYTEDATPGVLTFVLDGSSNVVTIDATNRVFIFEIVVYFAD